MLATGLVDENRVYMFGWSNGAFTSALYGVWRADRIAAIAQYAGANPWSRQPCPILLPAAPHTPLILVRNLCDAVVPCHITSEWIRSLTHARWPFESYNLLDDGSEAPAGQGCAADCPRDVGIHDHIRWPHKSVIEGRMLPFLKRHVRHAR